ncbi:MAG: type II toxin-antitoxin system VapC family toxin [Acidimicrobiia bacterium]|nr:type II toxin-antitoxin system VapC family toxin [Acidimicrobiia bacterium]
MSSWEITAKVGLGRLRIPEPLTAWLPSRRQSTGCTPIAVEHGHVIGVSALPMHHRDPFDRLLVAQAQALDVPILTADPAIAAYDVEVLPIGSP